MIDIIKPSNSKSSKWQECPKLDIRMQLTLKYHEITRTEDKRVVTSINEENMKLNLLLKKTITKRHSFNNHYEVNKTNWILNICINHWTSLYFSSLECFHRNISSSNSKVLQIFWTNNGKRYHISKPSIQTIHQT